ncbi:MAG: hypothetical protein LBB92_01575 [Endomicrobium sp.]|jgi:uncharacterized membrane protein required for colicin V production|nr:hypothetical protein [Endomicrobium sp.]
MARVGWSVGFTRIFFMILAGFLAIFVVNKYSHLEGLNLCLIFVITALFIIVIGCYFITRLINFLYMNFLDKISGLVLNVCIWLMLYINIIIPTVMTNKNYALDISNGKVYKTVSYFMKSRIPLLKDYVFPYVHLKSKLQDFKNKI